MRQMKKELPSKKRMALRIYNLIGIVMASGEEHIATLNKHKERFELLRDEASAAVDELNDEIELMESGLEGWKEEYDKIAIAFENVITGGPAE